MPNIEAFVGQSRAVEAMEFGLGIQREGYNIFALGASGTGKLSLVRQFFEQQASHEPAPDDWCYVHNFAQPYRPSALRLPPGAGARLRADMERLVSQLRTTLAAAFESEEYQTRRQIIVEELEEKQAEAFEGLQQHAHAHDFTLLRTPNGLAFAPAKEGQVLPPEVIQNLSEEERRQMEAAVEELQDELQKIVRQIPGWQREVEERARDLEREVANFAIAGLFEELREKYAAQPGVTAYLEATQKDVVENAADFLPPDSDEAEAEKFEPGPMEYVGGTDEPLQRYQVNVLVDHSNTQGAPVIYEDNPTYPNLVGRVEHMAEMGALLTNFNLIKPGALHRANGGYLILDARKVLLQPYTWEGLKRALQGGQIHIESIGQILSSVSTISLEPEPIPLRIKIALVGDRLLYYQLWQLDPDFGELFKVAADFEDELERTAENQQRYARLLATLARKDILRPLDRCAVARVIDHSARMAGDAERLSTWMRGICDLMQEADYWAGQAGRPLISADDVQMALAAQERRVDRVRAQMQEEILRGTVLIDTEGSVVGQVNGLAVLQIGNFSFGHPNRITAQVRLGKGDVLDIEREVELGGPLHSKGVLILTGFLGARYASERPLALTASLVFEQSYGEVDGDSASSAELYALLSAIAQTPLKQGLAVTGSVNQRGQVQAIGGVNEKIEGFFDICRCRGLTGAQGVLIPAANIKHLMLRQDVVEAVAAGRFYIYPVETIDQGLEVLTGLPAGERDARGVYPAGSFNALAEARLAQLAERRRIYVGGAGEASDGARSG